VARRVRGVEVGVEHGDGEATGVEEAGEPEHGVDVALVREREQKHVSAAPTVGRVAMCGHGWRWWWRHGFCCSSSSTVVREVVKVDYIYSMDSGAISSC
jgi:hypothetical protein